MQTYRIVPRTAPRACRAACSSTPKSSLSSRNMFTTPFFAPPPSHFNPVPEMAPFFRVLDTAVAELTNNTIGGGGAADQRAAAAARHQRRSMFTPRFDVREAGGSYELQGELPGIEQKDLEIEFVDDKTLVIRGRAEREFEDSNVLNKDRAVASSAEENQNVDKATSEHNKDDAASEHSASSYHKASVEDEDGFVDAGAEANNNTATAPVADDPDTSVPEQQPDEATQRPKQSAAEPQFKYWVSERSIGSFERRFAFPGRVDQEAVKASLRNGILSVVVPKIVEQGVRRIQIS